MSGWVPIAGDFGNKFSVFVTANTDHKVNFFSSIQTPVQFFSMKEKAPPIL